MSLNCGRKAELINDTGTGKMQTPNTEMLEIKLKYSFTFCKNLLTNETTNHITCFFSLQSFLIRLSPNMGSQITY